MKQILIWDGKYGLTLAFQNKILNGKPMTVSLFFDGNNNLLSSPLPNPFITGTQNI
jgi:hypothetical protein